MRLRIKYSKTGRAVYLGHLEMLRFWQRAIRRAGLPLAMSRGFNPHPRLAFGPALAVGIAGLGEYLDMELAADLEPEVVRRRLQDELPAGLELLQVTVIPDRAPALTAIIDTAAYRVDWPEPPDPVALRALAGELLERPHIPARRRGKDETRIRDIRPGIYDLNIDDGGSLAMLLQCSSRGAVRPDEVLEAMGLEGPRRITRTGLFIRRGNALLAPEDYEGDNPGAR